MFFKILIGLAAAFLAAVFLVRQIEARSIFFPMKAVPSVPLDVREPERVSLVTADGVTLDGWFLPGKAFKPVIFFLHGNAGHIGHRWNKLKMLALLETPIFILDYRGYGRSEGTPSERGLYRDAEAGYAELLKRGYNPDKIVVYGESIGGAVAIELASKRPVRAVVVEDTFTSIPDVVRRSLPFIPPFLLQTQMNSLSRIGRVRAPVLIFHSRDDEIIPYAMGRQLYLEANEPKHFVELRGGHNTAFLEDSQIYMKSLQEFFARL
jgi:fermentation-respiration switch protein FrsA (DUF1100 family)